MSPRRDDDGLLLLLKFTEVFGVVLAQCPIDLCADVEVLANSTGSGGFRGRIAGAFANGSAANCWEAQSFGSYDVHMKPSTPQTR